MVCSKLKRQIAIFSVQHLNNESDILLNSPLYCFNRELTQLTFTCLLSTRETLEKGTKYVQS